MKKTVGSTDKIIRILIALVLIALYFTQVTTGIWGTIALVAAAIMLITAVTGLCPIYSLLGINTCKLKSGD